MVVRVRPSRRRAFEGWGWKASRPEGDPAPPEVLSVALDESEEVRWIWTHTADGESVVTGYVIVEKEGNGRVPES